MKNSIYRVYGLWNGVEDVPLIKLRGKWLKGLGFEKGMRYELVYSMEGSLTIKRLPF